LEGKDRDAVRTLRQDRVAGGRSTVVCQRDPRGHRSAWQSRGLLEGEVARHRHDRFLAQRQWTSSGCTEPLRSPYTRVPAGGLLRQPGQSFPLTGGCGRGRVVAIEAVVRPV
jgi:hypothetical protein